jgi:type II secretory pathway pseudopilin PulG
MKMQNLRKTNETGRSMVEMLGVLAIIGVLSVGGVYGYGVAMKKHKANELLHQASMLATTVSAQAMTNDGKLPETTTSFANSSYGTFDQSVTEALDGKGFAITIKEVDSAVCGQLEKMGGGIMREATCNDTTATLNYYKNLATNDEEGKNGPTGGDNGQESNLCGGVPVTDCQQCNSFTGEIEYSENGKRCRINDRRGSCQNGECQIASYCEKNAGVLKGTSNQFCYYSDSMTWLDAAKKCTAKENPTEADIKKYMPTYRELGCTDSAYSCEGRNLPYSKYWTSACDGSTCEEEYVSNSGYAYFIYYSSPETANRKEQYGAICHNIDPEGYGQVPDDCPAGTSSTGKGGEVSPSLDCYCPKNEIWDTETSSCKEDDRPLYVEADFDTHYDMTSYGPKCPDGYHWATLADVFKDCDCTFGSECLNQEALSGKRGHLKDCSDSSGSAVVSCDGARSNFYIEGSSDKTPRSSYRDQGLPSLCRHSSK